MSSTELAYNLGYRVDKNGKLFLNTVPFDRILFVKKKKNGRNLLGFHLAKSNKLVYLSKLQAYQKYGDKALYENCLYLDGDTLNCSYENICIKSELDQYLEDNSKVYCNSCHKIVDVSEAYSSTNPHRIRKCKNCLKQQRKYKSSYMTKFKEDGCCICGETDVACLDFHHINDKKYQVSHMLTHSYDKIKEEINKCVVLCANCHRKLHYYNLTIEELKND